MDKNELLTIHGKSKVKEIAGILHNYTPNGTIEESVELEQKIIQYGNYRLSDAFPNLEDFLELN